MSCIKYDNVATLALLGQISDNNINVRTANGQDMGINGSVMVNFKIGPLVSHINLLYLNHYQDLSF